MYDKLDLWIKVCIDNIHICREYVVVFEIDAKSNNRSL